MIDGAMKPFHTPPKNPFDMRLCGGKPASTLEFDTPQLISLFGRLPNTTFLATMEVCFYFAVKC